MAQKIEDGEGSLNEVNVIPLADLSLVLLIILMVLSPMITQAMINVASANAQKAQNQQELSTPETPIIISRSPGSYKMNGQEMGSEEAIVERLKQIMPTRKNKEVLLTAAPQMEHGKVVRIMDIIRRSGASSLVMLKWDGKGA
jgi:biopolymer transport protein ExbD